MRFAEAHGGQRRRKPHLFNLPSWPGPKEPNPREQGHLSQGVVCSSQTWLPWAMLQPSFVPLHSDVCALAFQHQNLSNKPSPHLLLINQGRTRDIMCLEDRPEVP